MEWLLKAIGEGGVQGTFLIVWILVFVLTAAANLLGRLIPHATYLVLVLIRDIRIGHLNRDISDLAAPLLVYQLRAMKEGDTNETKIAKAMELARVKGLGALGQETISRAIGDCVSASFDRNRTQPARFAFVKWLLPLIGDPEGMSPFPRPAASDKPASKKRGKKQRKRSGE